MYNKGFVLLLLIEISLAQRTDFVDEESKLLGFAEPDWYKENIPFVELPDKLLEDLYYYRWSSHKRHLRYTIPGAGYIITEFIQTLERGYGQKFDAINAAAGHHIYESRWLKNNRYLQDYINYWAREAGDNQQYSEWISDASYAAFLVNGDFEFIKSQLGSFVRNYNGWGTNFIESMQMYTITPHNDAMEHSASSEQSEDGMFGGWGYRPSFNSEMYANAIAISKIASLVNQTDIAVEFHDRAEALRKAILSQLWDDERGFFFHMYTDNNPNNELLDTREEIGFFPWRWGVPDKSDSKYEGAWEHLFDPKGFESLYGPTTCEQRSKWFEGNQTNICCWWNGNSWPYSTGLTLNSLAAQIKYYSKTTFANAKTYMALLLKYATTQQINGKPYVGECHSALYDFWVCDARNHSEHYAHSTYVDNILSDLIGIEPQEGDRFQMNPLLIPSEWTYFIVENILYHGHNLTVLFDADGTKYSTGFTGLQIFVNGILAAVKPEIGLMNIPIPPPSSKVFPTGQKKVENYAANVYSVGYPKPDASFTSVWASTWQAVDGRVFYDSPVPSNRWTNWDSPNDKDWFSIDFGPGRVKSIAQVKLSIYSDFASGDGGVDCPTDISVEYFDVEVKEWVGVSNQSSTPCKPNDVLLINFEQVKAQEFRLVFTRNITQDTYVGFTEIEMWAPWPQTGPNVYEAEDGLIREGEIMASDAASGSSFVGGLTKNDSSVEITGVWIDLELEYQIQIHYATDDNNATTNLIVNNAPPQTITFPSAEMGSGLNFVTIQLLLLRGNNVFIFKRGDYSVQLDKLTVL